MTVDSLRTSMQDIAKIAVAFFSCFILAGELSSKIAHSHSPGLKYLPIEIIGGLIGAGLCYMFISESVRAKQRDALAYWSQNSVAALRPEAEARRAAMRMEQEYDNMLLFLGGLRAQLTRLLQLTAGAERQIPLKEAEQQELAATLRETLIDIERMAQVYRDILRSMRIHPWKQEDAS